MAFVYNNGAKLLNGSYWTTATIQALIVNDSYTTANRDDVFVSIIANSEASGSGYSRGYNSPGRRTLSSLTVIVDNATNSVKYGAADLSFLTVSAGTIGAIVIFEKKTSDADSPLIAYIDSATPQLTNGTSMPVLFENGLCFTITT